MKGLISTILVVSVMTMAGVFATAPAPTGSVAYAAEVSEKELTDQLAKIKKMVADIEAKIKAKKMMMDPASKEKAMKMLMDITKMLIDIESQRP